MAAAATPIMPAKIIIGASARRYTAERSINVRMVCRFSSAHFGSMNRLCSAKPNLASPKLTGSDKQETVARIISTAEFSWCLGVLVVISFLCRRQKKVPPARKSSPSGAVWISRHWKSRRPSARAARATSSQKF